jgi:hypothetical protein
MLTIFGEAILHERIINTVGDLVRPVVPFDLDHHCVSFCLNGRDKNYYNMRVKIPLFTCVLRNARQRIGKLRLGSSLTQ